jgi:hypothetical protein
LLLVLLGAMGVSSRHQLHIHQQQVKHALSLRWHGVYKAMSAMQSSIISCQQWLVVHSHMQDVSQLHRTHAAAAEFTVAAADDVGF